MAIISGPKLDQLVKDSREWYNRMRERLIADMERDGYAYGNVKLTEEEQLFKYLGMTPRDHADMLERLLQKYRGQPDALRRAGQDLQRYRQRMEGLRAKYDEQRGQPIRSTMEGMAEGIMRNALPPDQGGPYA